MSFVLGAAHRSFFRKQAIHVGLCALSVLSVSAQSNDQNFPTPVTENQVVGEIRARDIGDPRLTTFFYTFNGAQGDIFINVLTRNFSGDIDLFLADGLRLLSKIVVYPESSPSETGRVIYLRKPEKLILRVSGRSPNDDTAEFRLKFAGSFVSASADQNPAPPKLPEIATSNTTGIRVNSVGTILPPEPKPTPAVTKTETAATIETPTKEEKPSNIAVAVDSPIGDPKPEEKTAEAPSKEEAPAKPTSTRATRRTRRTTPPITKSSSPATAESPVAETKPAPKAKAPPAPKPKPPDPLANYSLEIVFKDGRKIERPMTEVLRFTVDRGILTVIYKNGTIGRYPIIEVESVLIR